MDFQAIEKWFTGKALKTLRAEILPLLYLAAEQGYWPKGASRKVTAALNKQAVAQKFARANDRRHDAYNLREAAMSGLLSDVCDNRKASYDAKLRGWCLVHSMMFGHFSDAVAALALADKLAPHCVNDAERAALATARAWAIDFAPVAELVATLDARRPLPTVVFKTLSPTVVSNVSKTLFVDLTSVAMPPIKYTWVKKVIKGKQVEVAVPEIVWPEGTRHGVSRFAGGSGNNWQCHACGHAIKNAFNWVPLVADTATGPISLWVGSDCARKLFECNVDGEADFSAARVE